MSWDFGAGETTAACADFLVELRGFEPLTSAVRLQRSPIYVPTASATAKDSGRYLFVLRQTKEDLPGFCQKRLLLLLGWLEPNPVSERRFETEFGSEDLERKVLADRWPMARSQVVYSLLGCRHIP